jgi:Cu2+-exporting ATPase
MQAAAIALDDPAEWQSFSRAAGGAGEWTSYVAIEGMWCASCTLAVEDALNSCAGVRDVQVNGATATARVTWSPTLGRPSEWWHALARAGYGAMPAADLLASAPRRREQRVLLWRWLVAGFCMMQVMMYAVPAYVAHPGEITPDIEALLRWASLLMTLPVLLFSCAPFFRAAWRDVRHARIGMDLPVALGILVAFVASTVATFDPTTAIGGDTWFDSITMFVFFLLSGRLLEQRLRDRTAGALEALARRLPETVERETAQGDFEAVAVRRLQPGDRIRILPAGAVPADGEIVEGESTFDEALLTGEARPVPRGQGEPVVAGSHNMASPVLVRVTRCGAQTRFASIVALMERASADKPRSAQIADRIAAPFMMAVVAASAVAGAWWWSSGPAHAIGVAIAVLIVTCPCALSLATPAATLAAAGAFARRGIIVRRLQAIEDAAGIDTVVFDKTGTLTQPQPGITTIRTRSGADSASALALAAALARHSLHPVSRAIVQAAPADGPVASEVREIAGQGVQGTAGTHRLRMGSASFCGIVETNGWGASVHLADERGWLASFTLDESLRAGTAAAVSALAAIHVRTQLLSGDRVAAVQRIAQRAGIAEAFGRHTPESKLAHVTKLQHGGSRIAMAGDGMNDGPVLARANVSIAMGDAVPLAQARCDFIVSGGQPSAVPLVLRHARRTTAIVRQNLAWAAAYNALCVPLAIAGWMPPWLAGLGMAASSLFVVANSARAASFVKGGE